jgi:deoxyribonuclease-4
MNTPLLGAHVSIAGGVHNAPARASEIEATAVQIFTKQPNRWAEPALKPEQVSGYREGVVTAGLGWTNAHDSYLINLATPDPVLRDRSYASFRAELERAAALGLHAIVTHPGNATDGDVERGLAQNAALVERALEEVPGDTLVLLETTAGSGRVLGARFEELAAMIERVAPPARHRMGVCFDTCHVFAAGYDLREDFDAAVRAFDDTIGLDRLRLFHLNDSLHPLGSRKDRHAAIGEGSLGDEPFRRVMTDPRFAAVPKVLETPKGDDPVAADRRNLARLRALGGEA